MTMVIKKTPIEHMHWKKVLARYPRLIACMIEESSGYFTPHAAVNAIIAYKKPGGYWNCEWYMDIDAKRHDNKICWNDPDYDDRIRAINREIIKDAIKRRKYNYSARAKQVVELNMGKDESVLAGWF